MAAAMQECIRSAASGGGTGSAGPPRKELGSYLMGVLPDDEANFVKFHLEVSRCRVCTASVSDLQAEQATTDTEEVVGRRKKYFQSSVGHLPRE